MVGRPKYLVTNQDLSVALHDGRVEAIVSDRLDRSVEVVIDVHFLRHFHHFADDSRFMFKIFEVSSVVATRIAEAPGGWPSTDGMTREEESDAIEAYRRLFRYESVVWNEFEQLVVDDPLDIYSASVSLRRNACRMQMQGSIGNDYYDILVKGTRLKLRRSDNGPMSLLRLLNLGQDYWDDFGT